MISTVFYQTHGYFGWENENNFLDQLFALKPDIPEKCIDTSCAPDCASGIPKIFAFKHNSYVFPMFVVALGAFAHLSKNHKLESTVYCLYIAFLSSWKINYIADHFLKNRKLTIDLL